MMQEKEWKTTGFSLYYEKRREGIEITRLQGSPGEAELPAYIEGMPVTAIGKKAFLSKKSLRRVCLPETVQKIGDWAFAYCPALTEVFCLGTPAEFGRAVFLDCSSLRHIALEGEKGQTSALLAAAVTELSAYYLLDTAEAGSAEWLAKWDARLFTELREPDGEGYLKQVLCGEEDYGSTDYGAFVEGKRKHKARLSFLRLLHPQGLGEEHRRELEGYLREHTKGCESEEAWQVLLEEYGDEREYYSLFAELSCVTEQNLQAILQDIGEDRPELKAFFLKHCREKREAYDFFDDLEL